MSKLPWHNIFHCVSLDHRGSVRHHWMDVRSMVELNEGSPARTASGDQNAGISILDVSLEYAAMNHRFSWETIPEFGSNHLPLLLIWDKDIKVEHVHTWRRSTYQKTDRPLFHKCIDNRINAVSSVGSLPSRLEAFCILPERAMSKAVPNKAVRRREIPWINA